MEEKSRRRRFRSCFPLNVRIFIGVRIPGRRDEGGGDKEDEKGIAARKKKRRVCRLSGEEVKKRKNIDCGIIKMLCCSA